MFIVKKGTSFDVLVDGRSAEMHGIIEAAMDAIISVNERQNVVVFNPAAEHMFGYMAGEVLGTSINRLIPDRFHTGHSEHIRKFGLTGSTSRRMGALGAVWGLRSNGQEFPIEASIFQMENEDGNLLYTVILRDITERYHHEDERKRNDEHTRFLMGELLHRSKNLLAIVSAIARITSKNSSTVAEFETRFTDRLIGLARSHDLLVEQQWKWTDLDTLIHVHLAPFLDGQDLRADVSGPEVAINPIAAQNIGMALHELATNSVKYGALSLPSGRLLVHWQVIGSGSTRSLQICWQEQGGPIVSPPKTQGFGRMVIEKVVPQAVDGNAKMEFDPTGITWTLDMPEAYMRPS